MQQLLNMYAFLVCHYFSHQGLFSLGGTFCDPKLHQPNSSRSPWSFLYGSLSYNHNFFQDFLFFCDLCVSWVSPLLQRVSHATKDVHFLRYMNTTFFSNSFSKTRTRQQVGDAEVFWVTMWLKTGIQAAHRTPICNRLIAQEERP